MSETVEDFVRTEVSRSFPTRPLAGLFPTKDAPLTGEQAVERLPASIRVGPFDYEIVKMTSRESSALRRWGEFSSLEAKIRISTNFPTPVKAVDTLLHEVGHAIWFAWGIEKGDDEERTVGNAATGWVSVYRDNPWLLDWLKECLK